PLRRRIVSRLFSYRALPRLPRTLCPQLATRTESSCCRSINSFPRTAREGVSVPADTRRRRLLSERLAYSAASSIESHRGHRCSSCRAGSSLTTLASSATSLVVLMSAPLLLLGELGPRSPFPQPRLRGATAGARPFPPGRRSGGP